MTKDEIKQLGKEIAQEAIDQAQEAFMVMLNDREEQNKIDMNVMLEVIRNDIRLFRQRIVDINTKSKKISNPV